MSPMLLLLAALAPAGAGYQPTLCDDLGIAPETPAVDFESDILPIFAEQGCATCHGWTSASARDRLVCVDATNGSLPGGFKLIVPNAPGESFLFHKVNCDDLDGAGSRMPRGGPPLPLSQQRLIFDWINQGAQPSGDIVFTGGFETGPFCEQS